MVPFGDISHAAQTVASSVLDTIERAFVVFIMGWLQGIVPWWLLLALVGVLLIRYFYVTGRAALRAPKASAPPQLEKVSRPQAGQLTAVRTAKVAKDREERLTVVEPIRIFGSFAELQSSFPPGRIAAEGQTARVLVDPKVRFQTFLGFGANIDEASAELHGKLTPEAQDKAVEACFSLEAGLGYRLGRVHINSCNAPAGSWSCCEKEDDMDLTDFTIKMYEKAVLPLLRRAATAAGEPLRLVATPWSPPGWMKDVRKMNLCGKLRPNCHTLWARFILRFVDAFREAGAPVWAVSVQNNPGLVSGSAKTENCVYSPAEERNFVRGHLGPAFEKASNPPQLLVGDEGITGLFARAGLFSADGDAARHAWGLALHAEADAALRPARLALLRACWPGAHLIVTQGLPPAVAPSRSSQQSDFNAEWLFAETCAAHILNALEGGAEAWLNESVFLPARGRSSSARGVLLVDERRGSLLFQPAFFHVGHFSRFILPSAERVLCSSNRDGLECTSFLNGDGTLAVIVLNRTEQMISFQLFIGALCAHAQAPKHSITTFLMSM